MADILTTLHPESDENTNLYPNIRQQNIPAKVIDRSKLDDNINNLLNNIGELNPSGVDTSTNILAFTTNKGIYIGSDTGKWYYWNGSQYVEGGLYVSISNESISENVKKANSIIGRKYELFTDNWELGTLFVTGTTLYKTDATDVIRLKEPIYLPLGTIIKTLDAGCQIRVVLEKDNLYYQQTSNLQGQTTTGYVSSFVIIESGYYYLAYNNAGVTISSIADKLQNLSIIIPNDVMVNEYTKIELCNLNTYSYGFLQNYQGGVLTRDNSIGVLTNYLLLSLSKGTFIYCDDGYAFRLVIKKGNNYLTISYNSSKLISSYYCDEDIECYITLIKKADASSDNTKWFNHLHFIENSNIEKDCYYLDYNNFESGSFYCDGGYLYFSEGVSVSRKVTLLNLKSGDIIKSINGYDFRLISKNNAAYTYTWGDNTWKTYYEIETDGEYLIVLRDSSNVEINVQLAIQNIILAKANNYLSNYLKTLEKYEQEDINDSLDYLYNRAKSIVCVMTYNVGSWYNGSGQSLPSNVEETYVALQNNIIKRYYPDVMLIQEYRSIPTSIINMLNKYFKTNVNYQGATAYNGKSNCSNIEMFDYSEGFFVNHDGINRNYVKAYSYINGRKVCFINTHLSTDTTISPLEVTELYNLVQNEDYFVIGLDSNLDAKDSSFNIIFADFISDGCKFANDGTYETADKVNTAIDNIITSSNINIKGVVMDTQKSVLDIDDRDHYPLIAYLEIF